MLKLSLKAPLAAIENKYSVTFIGVIVLILTEVFQRLNVTVANEALTTTVETLVFIVGALLVTWGRKRKGDVSWFGLKK